VGKSVTVLDAHNFFGAIILFATVVGTRRRAAHTPEKVAGVVPTESDSCPLEANGLRRIRIDGNPTTLRFRNRRVPISGRARSLPDFGSNTLGTLGNSLLLCFSRPANS
jgi:hypothetical protein